jgi:hypothetical protein
MQHTVTITAASLAALAPDGKLELSTADQVKYVFDASDGAIAFDRVILDSGKQKTPMSQVVEKIAADMGVTVAHLEERTFGVWAETLAASAPSEGDGAGNFLRMTYCYERIYYDDSTCQCVRYFDIAYLCGYAP